ncbi:MAG: YjbH domain-containing protein [Candidatus Cloacimonetes bacterium]|nr:YjbH domain-containing protein [Candidatus Cloacimonadota bacterium]
MKRHLTILLLLAAILPLSAFELRQLVDAPTAGVLQRGEAVVYSKVYRNNGLLTGAEVGLFPRFMFGVSYGGENVVGNAEPIWHDRVEFRARFRIIDEGPKYPAVVVGFDSQGHGIWHGDTDRYDIKSKGFYVAGSRNFLFMGNLGLHAGINFSLETADEDKDINLWLGIDKSIGSQVTFMCEYDLALNDNDDRVDVENDQLYGAGKGYLNAGVSIRFTDAIDLRVLAYDLLENSPGTVGLDRAVMISYQFSF